MDKMGQIIIPENLFAFSGKTEASNMGVLNFRFIISCKLEVQVLICKYKHLII